MLRIASQTTRQIGLIFFVDSYWRPGGCFLNIFFHGQRRALQFLMIIIIVISYYNYYYYHFYKLL